MVDPALLAVARGMLDRALAQTCSVERSWNGEDEDGLTVRLRDLIHDGAACRVTLTDGSKNVAVGGGSVRVDATITLAWGLDIQAGDVVTVDDREWRVLAVKTGPLAGTTVAQCASLAVAG